MNSTAALEEQSMKRSWQTAAFALVGLGLLAVPARAGSPAEWIKRILDPKKIDLAMPEGASLNRKLSVDYISHQDPPTEMAVYTMDLAKLAGAAAHFEKTLGAKPDVAGSGELAIYRFDFTGAGDHPKGRKGLLIQIAKSQWIDSKLQITMWYTPPK
jgi:hypothetical protein